MVKRRSTDPKNNYYKNYRESYSRGSATRGRNSYYSHRGYSRNNGKYFHSNQWERIPSGHNYRPESRPLSPVEGSEEFMTRKIQQTSAIIMRQLLSPNEPLNSPNKSAKKDVETDYKIKDSNNEYTQPKETKDRQNEKDLTKSRKISTNEINVQEIHDKIMTRITNLNEGKKKNFINAHASNTSLDSAIQHIHKQKRLELSRVLRDMCSSSDNLEISGELINSIVPDIGIKLEELPIDVIQELRYTLNLDFDEDVLDFDRPEVLESASPEVLAYGRSCNSEELNDAINSIQGKTEDNDNFICNGSIEIKPEDICDLNSLDDTQCNSEETEPNLAEEAVSQAIQNDIGNILDLSSHSVIIKDEASDDSDCDSDALNSSQSTVLFPNTSGSHKDQHIADEQDTLDKDIFNQDYNPNEDNRTNTENCENASSQTEKSLTSLENFISTCVEDDTVLDMSDINEVCERVETVDRCLKYLSEYKHSLIKTVLDHCKRLNKNRKGIEISQNETAMSNNILFSNRLNQTIESVSLEDEYQRVIKRRKVENKIQEIPIKTEKTVNDLLEEQDLLIFPKLQTRVMVIEKVDDQLLLATESGNIIYVSLKDGTFLHTIDVTNSPITSLIFLKGMNEFIFIYVGCLDNVLRIYDFKSREIKKATPIADHIRCMDAMWDYVFMGCRDGTLIRYSTKKGKVEFEEKNTGTDILVLKAAQEGPRRVLLVGHKQAPIYVRDAMSGLYLRNFSNKAITPTVYALIVNNNYLYCGTAQSNILVFSFHEGNFLNKLFAENCKGISCMKIYKDLLFSGGYNGSIYIYNLKIKKVVMTLNGPGGSISCMEVLSNQVIVGTLSGNFGSVPIPAEVLEEH